jgi:hypothetical protein
MQTLSYGYKLPETGDFGDVWFPALEDNITRVNSHDHDGVNSTKLISSNISASYVSVASGSFSLVSGKYRATVDTPVGSLVDDFVIVCKDPTSKDQIFLEVEKLDDNTVYLYSNLAIDVEVYFLS